MNSIIKICATFLIAMLSIIFLSCNSPNNDISTSNLQEANASENELAPIVNNYIEEGRMIVEETEPENGILVIGEGSLKVNPDIAVVNMGIQVERRTASNARKEAAISMQNLLDAITETDVEAPAAMVSGKLVALAEKEAPEIETESSVIVAPAPKPVFTTIISTVSLSLSTTPS